MAASFLDSLSFRLAIIVVSTTGPPSPDERQREYVGVVAVEGERDGRRARGIETVTLNTLPCKNKNVPLRQQVNTRETSMPKRDSSIPDGRGDAT